MNRAQHKFYKDLIDLFDLAQKGPPAQTLARSPVLTEWTPVLSAGSAAPILIGNVTGHPFVPDASAVYTSILIAIDPGNGDPDNGWARTKSRWYRLDGPLHVQSEPLNPAMFALTRRYRSLDLPLRQITDIDELHQILASLRRDIERALDDAHRRNPWL